MSSTCRRLLPSVIPTYFFSRQHVKMVKASPTSLSQIQKMINFYLIFVDWSFGLIRMWLIVWHLLDYFMVIQWWQCQISRFWWFNISLLLNARNPINRTRRNWSGTLGKPSVSLLGTPYKMAEYNDEMDYSSRNYCIYVRTPKRIFYSNLSQWLTNSLPPL